MNATFVQVETLELARFQRDPSLAEALFQGGSAVPDAFVEAAKTLQNRMKTIDPLVLAGSLARLGPSLQEQLAQRFGKPPAELSGDDIVKLMEERFSRLSAQAPKESRPHPALSLDKAWHGVHYLLCGETEPGTALLSQPVLGGTALGDDDEGFSGYGPARYFTAAEVAQLAQELSRSGLESEAAARFDAQSMSELQIYPGWATSDADWVLDAFRRLRDFYADAATNGRAIVTCIV